MEIGRRVGAGIADIVTLPGQFAWEIDPATGKLRRKYEREGFFPISRDAADKGAGSERGASGKWGERGASGKWSPDQGGAQPLAPFVTPDGRRVVDQIPGQNVAPAAPAGIDFQTANDAAQQKAGLGALLSAATPGATPSSAPQPAPRGPGGIASPAAPTATPSELDDMQRSLDRLMMEGQKLETPEEAEKRIRKGYEEKFPSELPERLKELTAEAQSAVKARDQDRWLAVAMGGFAAAAGESPYALKNFAQGLGLTAKEFMSINKDFQAAEKERKKMELALRQQDRAERMGIEGKALDARERASEARTKYDQFLAGFQQKISETGINVKLAREQMAQRERLGMAQIAATRAAGASRIPMEIQLVERMMKDPEFAKAYSAMATAKREPMTKEKALQLYTQNRPLLGNEFPTFDSYWRAMQTDSSAGARPSMPPGVKVTRE
jgi:hypothetical protein